jgi:hypothetical protein
MVQKTQKCSYITIKKISCVQWTESDLFLNDPQTQQVVYSVNTEVTLSSRPSMLMKGIENRRKIFSKISIRIFRPRPL